MTAICCKRTIFNPPEAPLLAVALTSTCLTLFVPPPPSFAGEEGGPTDVESSGPFDEPALESEVETPYGFGQLKADVKFLLTKPAHLDKSERLQVLGTALVTAGLYATRHDIRDEVQEHRTESRDQFLQNVRTMGKGAFAPSLALIFWSASFGTKSPREKETAFLLLESAGFSALASGVGQFVIASERPEDGAEVRYFQLGGHGVSTDAALAASVVPPLRNQYLRFEPDDGPWMRLWKGTATTLLYSGAALTAYQRMNQDKHWAPDAFLGLMTGLSVGETLCQSHGKGKRSGIRFEPSPVPGGVVLTFRIPLREPGALDRIRAEEVEHPSL
jgi:hypothetical protein